MRAEERHKMHQNELADWLGKWIGRIKPYSNVAILGVLLAVLAALAFAWWNQQSAGQAAVAWDAFYRGLATGDPDTLKGVEAQDPGSNAAHWAAVLAGDVYLSNGCQRLFENKSKAADDLQKAINQYRLVEEGTRKPELLQRATFGLARAYEALTGTEASAGSSDGGTGQWKGAREKAIEEYQKVVDQWPDGPYADLAARRAAQLKQQDIKAFYDKFAKFDPRPALPNEPGLSGDRPPFSLDSLSEDGDLPGVPESVKPDDGSGTLKKEAAPSTKADDDSPAAADAATEHSSATPREGTAKTPAKPLAKPLPKEE
jgi:tetratricopeptide (TPR) repeat protein